MNINFDLNDLIAFRAIVECGSFRKAAEAVHLSQPAYSRRIDKLERALGVRLLERTTRRVKLTAVGREFERKVRAVLDDLDHAVLGIRGDAATRVERVTVACVPSAVHYHVSNALQRFREKHPRVQVAVFDAKANEVRSAVAQGDADFGFTFVSAEDDDVDFLPLIKEPFVLACQRDHPFAKLEKVSWSQVVSTATPFIAVARTSDNRLIVDRALVGVAARPPIAYEVQSGTAALGLVEAGLGVAALPAMAMPGPEHSVLVGVPLIEPSVSRTMGLIRRRNRALSGTAQWLFDLFTRSCVS
ncbi:LysR family transcriptional regulator [Trinickia sp. EG282A]|uniref:LysR family transcriptional regulator n=1 Tax=Trinickia sp. EG282A TaxID=3237013 RepID=UPI0034D24123